MREDFRCRDAQGHHRHRYGGSSNIWARDIGFGKDGEIRAVSRENDIVDREESHAALCGRGDVARVNGEHVRRHVGREVVDGHCECFRENIGHRFSFDACKDSEHSTEVNERLKIMYSGNQLNSLRAKALEAFADITQFRVCQLGRNGCDRVFRDSAESRTRQISWEGHIGHRNSNGRV